MRNKVVSVLFWMILISSFTGCSNDTVDAFLTPTTEPKELPGEPFITQGITDMPEAVPMNLPDGYHYEKIKRGFLEYLNFESWFKPNEMPQIEHELTYELYRPEKKEGMKDIVHHIWIKCRTEDGDRWYKCNALTNGKLAGWTEEYHFYYSPTAQDNDGELVYLGKDTLTIPTVTKPEFVENEEQQHRKTEIFNILENGIREDVYEQLIEGGYREDLKIEFVVSDFSIEKGFMPYSYLLINDKEVFACQFEVGIYEGNVYAGYLTAFGVNYTIDWELSWQYSSGSVWVFDGNQIKPLDAADKSAMERIKEAAVFQYSYSGTEG